MLALVFGLWAPGFELRAAEVTSIIDHWCAEFPINEHRWTITLLIV